MCIRTYVQYVYACMYVLQVVKYIHTYIRTYIYCIFLCVVLFLCLCLLRADIESKVERHEDDIVAFRQDLEDKKKLFESLQEEVQSAHYKYHDITNALERLKDKLDAASMDQRELEKQRQNRELLENLKRLFPGVVSGGERYGGRE